MTFDLATSYYSIVHETLKPYQNALDTFVLYASRVEGDR